MVGHSTTAPGQDRGAALCESQRKWGSSARLRVLFDFLLDESRVAPDVRNVEELRVHVA